MVSYVIYLRNEYSNKKIRPFISDFFIEIELLTGKPLIETGWEA